MRLHNKTMQHFESGVYSTLVLFSPGLGAPQSDPVATRPCAILRAASIRPWYCISPRTRTLRANQTVSALIGSMGTGISGRAPGLWIRPSGEPRYKQVGEHLRLV